MKRLIPLGALTALLLAVLVFGCRTGPYEISVSQAAPIHDPIINRSPGSPTQPPSSGVFFNDRSGGDLRARVEDLFRDVERDCPHRFTEKSVLRVYDVRELMVKLDDFPGVDIKLRSGVAENRACRIRPGTAHGGGSEAYKRIVENPYRYVQDHPLSTFSLDVDTASYSNVRRFLDDGRLPPPDAVRVEELVNNFEYEYPEPVDRNPFAVCLEINACPWNPLHRIVRIGIKARSVQSDERPPANLVFLLDVSGSMSDENKLPLLKKAMKLLVQQLRLDDQVAVVTYSNEATLLLPSTPCTDKAAILDAVDGLKAEGSTNWSEGAELAYRIASENFLQGGINRVILATDGDFNVGVTDEGGIVRLVEEKAKSGVFLTALGFGTGNYKDANLEAIAGRGNGNAAYIDDFDEAKKVLVEGLAGTLHTVAKDVKVQVEFNPVRVLAYRLIGYENRILAKEDFNDEGVDAGDVGAGQTVTALYEIVPVGGEAVLPNVDALRYQEERKASFEAHGGESLFLKIRYKEPDGSVSKSLCFPVTDFGNTIDQASADFRFACAAASFGLLLRGSKHKGSATFENVRALAVRSLGRDTHGHRTAFLDLVGKASALAENTENAR